MRSDVQEWRDESPFMYAAAPNGRVGVGVDARAGLVNDIGPEEDRWGCACRAMGVWGCGATTWTGVDGVGASGEETGCRSWLWPWSL